MFKLLSFNCQVKMKTKYKFSKIFFCNYLILQNSIRKAKSLKLTIILLDAYKIFISDKQQQIFSKLTKFTLNYKLALFILQLLSEKVG